MHLHEKQYFLEEFGDLPKNMLSNGSKNLKIPEEGIKNLICDEDHSVEEGQYFTYGCTEFSLMFLIVKHYLKLKLFCLFTKITTLSVCVEYI